MIYHVFRNQVSPGPAPHGTWSVPYIEGHVETCQCDKCRGIDDVFTRVIARGVTYDEAVETAKALVLVAAVATTARPMTLQAPSHFWFT